MKLKTKYERHNFNCGENLVLLEILDLGSHDNRVFLTRDEKENRAKAQIFTRKIFANMSKQRNCGMTAHARKKKNEKPEVSATFDRGKSRDV